MNNYQHLLKDLERASARSRIKLNPDQKLSLCMIVRNEEKYLADALKSVQDVVDEMIVVDTGSTDNTVEIARKYGARVFFYEWNDDFAAARNESLRHATGDWILMMDADERLDEHLKDNLRIFLIDSDRPIRYQVFIRNYMREKDESSILGHYMVRLFKKTPDTRFFGVIHEQIYPNVGIVTVPQESLLLWHYGYENVDFKAKKIEERNIPLIRKALQQAEDANHMELYSFYAFYLGSSLVDPAEAQKWLKIAIDSDPEVSASATSSGSAHIPVAYIDYLRTFYYLNDVMGGIVAAQEALQKYPEISKYPDFWDFYGTLRLLNQQADEAIDCFQNAIRLVTVDKEQSLFFAAQNSKIGGWGTLLNLAMAMLVKQNPVAAEDYLRQAMELYPGADKSKLVQEFQKTIGNTSLLQNYFEQKLRQDQGLSFADVKNLSNIYLQQEKPFEALMLQSRAYGLEKTIKNAFELCKIYEMNGRPDLALKTCQGILGLAPDNFQARLQKVILILLLEKAESLASAYFEELCQACQTSEDWLTLADFCLQVQAYAQAQTCLNHLLEAEPEHYRGQLCQALLFQLQEHEDQAEHLLKNLALRFPDQPSAEIQLGNLYLAAQRFPEAEALFLALQQKYTELDWYVPYALGIAALAQGHLHEASQRLQSAQALAPEQPEILQALALLQEHSVGQGLA